MSRAFVLMTAMPPTKGHLHLIEFAYKLAGPGGHPSIIVCTQPGEPFIEERVKAIRDATEHLLVDVRHLHRTIQQAPHGEDPAFWEMWERILRCEYFMNDDDYIVSSEPYGVKLAEATGGIFMPYDMERLTTRAKASRIRVDPRWEFDQILPEFQKHMRYKVTIFGAESTGKTTLAKELSELVYGHYLCEWARPYLETVGPHLDADVMRRIWLGQKALQDHADYLYDKPFVVQDTDLFSTLGYWFLNDRNFGLPPNGLVEDAIERKSDLYLITQSNIPFVPDPLRYGVTEREGSDQFWIEICEHYGLNYKVLEESRSTARVVAASDILDDAYDEKFKFTYKRLDNEHLV